jgi:hypothetical protein
MKYATIMNAVVFALNLYLALAHHILWSALAAGVSFASTIFAIEIDRMLKKN